MISKNLCRLVGEAIGEASMCWSEKPSGIYDTDRAIGIANTLIFLIEKEMQKNKENNVAD